MGRLASGLALFLILAALASRADALVDCGSQTWCPSNPDAKCDCEIAPEVITTCAFGQRCAEQGSGFYNCVAFTCSTPVDPVVSAANCDSGGAAWTPSRAPARSNMPNNLLRRELCKNETLSPESPQSYMLYAFQTLS